MDVHEDRLIESNMNEIYGNHGDILKALRDATLHDDVLMSKVASRAEAMSTSLEFYTQYLLEDKLEDRAKTLKKKRLLQAEKCNRNKFLQYRNFVKLPNFT